MRVILSRDTTAKLLLATALFFATPPVKTSGGADSELLARQAAGTAHDTQCNEVMCIECSVEGSTARYVLRTLGTHKLGWMGIGFGRSMADSPMVVVWPSRGEDGNYNSVTLSQRKAPYEVMPKPDPHPPFVAKVSYIDTWLTLENPQITFTRPAPPDGMQNIIWAFSRTPPASSDADSDFSIHHKIGRGVLNLTRNAPNPPDPPPLPPPPPPLHHHYPQPEPEQTDENAEVGGGGGSASFVHGVLCTAGFLIVLPVGALVARYAKVTGRSRAFRLHRILQLGLAGASIAGGSIAYFFMDDHDSGIAHKVGGVGLVLLYVVQCAIGTRVHRVPVESRTGAQSALMAILGAVIVLLAFIETWLGLLSAGRNMLVWSVLLFVVPALYVLGVMTVQRRFGGTQEDAKGEYVALDTRTPPDDELEDGDDEKL